jgi:hypothetical protein
MESENQIINRVASSGLITFDLETYYQPGDRVQIDVAGQLFQGLILREKDFRDFIKSHDWSFYKGKFVAVTCTVDAIIPAWAYMLIASSLQPFALDFAFGNLETLEARIFSKRLQMIDWRGFDGAKVVVKGCSSVTVPAAVFMEVTSLLRPYAASIMFGEPCSTVPVYKRPKV